MKCPNNIKNFLGNLKNPNEYLCETNKRTNFKLLVLLFVYFLIGLILNNRWRFPCFIEFSISFGFIGILAFNSIVHFSKEIRKTTSVLANQPAAQKANLVYFRYCKNSKIYIFAPIAIVLIFGISGCSMFGALTLSPSFFWVMVLFVLVVYISIIGYLQYVVLAIYIYNLASSSKHYNNLPKTSVGCSPAQVSWLVDLTRLSHTYRSRFFTLGSSFIFAFAAFCWLPKMHVDTSSIAFYLLWGIILIVVVMFFPIVSLLEHKWIKEIVSKLKNDYIKDLTIENKLAQKAREYSEIYSNQLAVFAQIMCTNQIINSRDYPIKSLGATFYATCLSILNLIATLVTIIQGITAISI